MGRKRTLDAEQGHGKAFEGHVKTLFYGGPDKGNKLNSLFDIDASVTGDGLPKNVKTSKGSTIDLADARAWWSIKEDYTLTLGRYVQKANIKDFYEVLEWKITKNQHKDLLGGIPASSIEHFHNSLTKYGAGEHEKARSWAKAHKKTFSSSPTTLNPKVDSKMQRRLQCSITIKRLTDIVGPPTSFTDEYEGTPLPRYKSPPRNERSTKEPK